MSMKSMKSKKNEENKKEIEDDKSPFNKIRCRRLHIPQKGYELYGRRYIRDLLIAQGHKRYNTTLEKVYITKPMVIATPQNDLADNLFLDYYSKFNPTEHSVSNLTLKIDWNLTQDIISTEILWYRISKNPLNMTLIDFESSKLSDENLTQEQKTVKEALKLRNPSDSKQDIRVNLPGKFTKQEVPFTRQNETIDTTVERIFNVSEGNFRNKRPFQYCYSEEGNIFAVKSEKNNVCHYEHDSHFHHIPDPCYAQEIPLEKRMKHEESHIYRGQNLSSLHCDLLIPKNLLPESRKILKILEDWKSEIAQKIEAHSPGVHIQSLRRIVAYPDPFLPLAWKTQDAKWPAVVWNLFDYRKYSLVKSFPVRIDNPGFPKDESHDYDRTVVYAATVGHECFQQNLKHTHVAENSDRGSSSRNGNGKNSSTIKIMHPPGSRQYARSIFQNILAYDWPVKDRADRSLLMRSPSEAMITKLQKAVQELIVRIFPNQEVFNMLKKNPSIDHHLMYQFLEENPHQIPLATNWPGIFNLAVYSEVNAQIDPDENLNSFDHCVKKYHCLPLTPDIMVSNVLGEDQIQEFDKSTKISSSKKDWYQRIFSQKILKNLDEKQLNNFLKKIPPQVQNENMIRKIKSQEYRQSKQIFRLIFSPKEQTDIIQNILKIPLDLQPCNHPEWKLFSLFNFGSDLTQELKYKYIAHGLWLSAIKLYRKNRNENNYNNLCSDNTHIMKEFSHIIESIFTTAYSVTQILDQEETDAFIQEIKDFFVILTQRGRGQVKRTLNRWNTYAHYLSRMEDEAYFYKTGISVKDGWKIMSWPTLLDKDLKISSNIKSKTKNKIKNEKDTQTTIIREISNVADLKQHGEVMKHCVGMYTMRCLDEMKPYHILEFIQDDVAVATASVVENEINLEKEELIQKYIDDPKQFKNSQIPVNYRTLKYEQFLGVRNRPIENAQLQAAFEEAQEMMKAILLKKKSRKPDMKKRKEVQELLKYQKTDEVQCIAVYWRWKILQKIVKDLPDIPEIFFTENPSAKDKPDLPAGIL